MKPQEGARENPLDTSVSLPALSVRLLCIALAAAVLICRAPAVQWMAALAMLLTVVVVWGRHVLFIDNLHGMPWLRAGDHDETAPLDRVSVIVSARNEELGIEPAARSLAALNYPDLEILLVDDHSTDGTPRILEGLAAELPRLRVLRAPAVPNGWTGKTHACWFGFSQSAASARWLLFTDARVVFHQDTLRIAVSYAEAHGLSFLSCIQRFEGESLKEELMAVSQNRSLVASARAFGGGQPAVPFGLGPFLMIRRDLYAASGGHSVFPGQRMEDFMLASLARRRGAKSSVAIAAGLLRLRRYQGFADMQRRVRGGLRIGASDRILCLVNRITIETALCLLPLPVAIGAGIRLAVSGRFQPGLLLVSILGFLAYLAGTCSPRSCGAICRRSRLAIWLHPLGAALWIWLLLAAIADRLRGQDITWRGRVVDAP